MKVWVLGFGLVAGVAGGQILPATAPTKPALEKRCLPGGGCIEVVPPVAVVPVAPIAPAAAVPAQHRAKVEFVGKMLAVQADNSSLNGILREVSRVTGMKITGGVAEERVYGSYGPGDVSAVLAQLVGGTGSNMLLILDAKEMPAELILTPRQGGASPPSPAMAQERGDDDDSDRPPQMKFGGLRQAVAPARPVGLPAFPAEATTTPAAVSAEDGKTTTQVSPNGVKTPQQIYDQLMQLQQQQKAPK